MSVWKECVLSMRITGHIATNCHEPPPRRGNEQNKKGVARVFTLTQQEATENQDVIADVLSINELPVYVLNTQELLIPLFPLFLFLNLVLFAKKLLMF